MGRVIVSIHFSERYRSAHADKLNRRIEQKPAHRLRYMGGVVKEP